MLNEFGSRRMDFRYSAPVNMMLGIKHRNATVAQKATQIETHATQIGRRLALLRRAVSTGVHDRVRYPGVHISPLPTLTAFSEYVGMSKSQWANYEAGTNGITPGNAMTLASKFPGVTLDWVYMGSPLKEEARWLRDRLEEIVAEDKRNAVARAKPARKTAA